MTTPIAPTPEPSRQETAIRDLTFPAFSREHEFPIIAIPPENLPETLCRSGRLTVIGNQYVIPHSIFQPAYTLSSVIANEFTEATGPIYPAALIELGLVLILVTLLVNIFALLLVHSASNEARLTA